MPARKPVISSVISSWPRALTCASVFHQQTRSACSSDESQTQDQCSAAGGQEKREENRKEERLEDRQGNRAIRTELHGSRAAAPIDLPLRRASEVLSPWRALCRDRRSDREERQGHA